MNYHICDRIQYEKIGQVFKPARDNFSAAWQANDEVSIARHTHRLVTHPLPWVCAVAAAVREFPPDPYNRFIPTYDAPILDREAATDGEPSHVLRCLRRGASTVLPRQRIRGRRASRAVNIAPPRRARRIPRGHATNPPRRDDPRTDPHTANPDPPRSLPVV